MAKQSVRKSAESAKTRVSRTVLLLRGISAMFILGGIFILSRPGVLGRLGEGFESRVIDRGGADTHGGVTRGDVELATLFTSEVLYWKDDIIRWGRERGLNPNVIATIIQIESCGHPYVTSNAGAQGLFQVMPLHFGDGENQLNPETNAQRGLDHLQDCLWRANYDVGLAFACYNGGASVLGLPQSEWYEESRNYYTWGTGIYGDASHGEEISPTLESWLQAGGSRLCEQARLTQDLLIPQIVMEP
jgi:hypothetical protein